MVEPTVRSLRGLPTLPPGAAWAFFLRNHDELDLSKLAADERGDCFRAFAPDENTRLYNQRIRRRLALMFGGDQARPLLAYSLIFNLPGNPVI